jgi:hypothetical protein
MAFQRHMATNPSSGVDNVTGDLGGVDLALHGFPGIDGLFVTDRFRRVEKSQSTRARRGQERATRAL